MPDFNVPNALSKQPLSVALNELIERTSPAEMPRHYLGASAIGDECARRIQYDWWCKPDLLARTKRIFERGHFFEARVREQLKEAGFRFSEQPANLEFSTFDGAFRGHADGLILSAPELSNMHLALPALWECKCLNDKNWNAIERGGLAKVFPKYQAQVAVYQHFLNQKNPALFTAANANDCKLLHFVVPYDAQAAIYWADRAQMIIAATRAGELLPRFTTNPEDWRCGMCPHKKRCWK